MGSAPKKLVDFEEALRIARTHAKALVPRGVERVPLLDATGRVLAEAVHADRDQPAFDRATRDGFAVHAAALAAAGSVRIFGQVRAGAVWEAVIPGDAAVEIMTGAPLPEGADAVLMVEHAVLREGLLSIAAGRSLSAGENVVPRASEARKGEEVLGTGALLGAAEIALAASCGCLQLSVSRRPAVAVVATGDELVELHQSMGPHQIRNSNSYAIAAMVAVAGGSPTRLTIARDVKEEIRERIVQGRNTDLLVLSGGVSMGKYDLVEEVLEELGAEFFFTGVKMQPGKPLVFGRLPASGTQLEQYFFGLPGNPVSTQVTFRCFAEPFLRALTGVTNAGPRWAQATLAEDIAAKAGPTRLLPCYLSGVMARPIRWQGSGDLRANARANCYAELLPGRAYGSGIVVRVLLTERF